MEKRQKCPYCGSIDTAFYLYGEPNFNKSLEKKLERGEYILGGCCVHTECVNGKTVFIDPPWRCNKCRKDFGTEPVLFNKKSQKDEFYTDIVTSLQFEVHHFRSTYVTITKAAKGADIVFDLEYSPYDGEQKKHISSAEWKRIVNTLYKKLYLHEWKKSYFKPVCDGEGWSLEVKLTDQRRRYYHGSNAYPPYWDELKELFHGLNQRLIHTKKEHTQQRYWQSSEIHQVAPNQ